MTFRFAVIGDSLAQGVHSGAIGDTAWSFPAILARALGLTVGTELGADFRVPKIPGQGLPINLAHGLDAIARAMDGKARWWKWIVRAVPALAAHLERMERFYESGPGARPLAFSGVFHNLAMYGLTTHESHTLTAERCGALVRWSEGRELDSFVALPSAHRQRAARMVLDPARQPGRGGATQLDNLEFLVRGERAFGIEPEPLDAVLVWLGSNDCLQTVVQLELRDMPARGGPRSPLGRPYNLTSQEQFARDFDAIAERIARILRGSRTRVYVGNVPDITIPPIAKGLGERVGDNLYERYGRFFLGERDPHWLVQTLDHEEAAIIQQRIAAYNRHIQRICERHESFAYVDTAEVLQTLAVRRNVAPGETRDLGRARRDRELRRHVDALAEQRMRQYAELVQRPDHPLLRLTPVPSVLMLETDARGRRIGGGLTSLDGVHPSTIGYGIAAEGFLRRLQVDFPSLGHAEIPWDAVIEADAVLRQPPSLWDDVRRLLSTFSLPSDWVFRWLPLG